MPQPEPPARWRDFADWAKKRPWVLRLADRMGRGQGRLRLFDRVTQPMPAPVKPSMLHWDRHETAALWIGHATVLVRIAGMNILCDPVFSRRIGLGLGLGTLGPQRLIAPAITHRQLPKIDLLLVSHAHLDHLDRPSLTRFSRQTPVLTAHHCGDLISDLGFTSVQEVRWNESTQIGDVRVTALEVDHWGARTFFDMHRRFNAFLIESHDRKILFAGDTAFTHHFDHLRDIDLAIMPIGAYDPYIQAHARPEQAWSMFTAMSARQMMPIHHSTFRLSYEPMHEPMDLLLRSAGDQQHRIVARQVGEVVDVG